MVIEVLFFAVHEFTRVMGTSLPASFVSAGPRVQYSHAHNIVISPNRGCVFFVQLWGVPRVNQLINFLFSWSDTYWKCYRRKNVEGLRLKFECAIG